MFATFAKNISLSATGTGKAVGAFKELGISVRDSNGNIRDTEEVYREVVDRFGRMQDGAQKTSIANRLLGQGFAAMIPVLNSGSKGLKDAADEAKRFGLIIDKETSAAAERFNDDLQRMRSLASGLGLQLGMTLIPIFNKLLDQFNAIGKTSFWGWLMSSGEDTRNAVAEAEKLTASLAEMKKQLAEHTFPEEGTINKLKNKWFADDRALLNTQIASTEKKLDYLRETIRTNMMNANRFDPMKMCIRDRSWGSMRMKSKKVPGPR